MKKIMLPVIFLSFSLAIYAQQWVVQTSGVTTSLRTVSVIDENVAWASGNSGVALRTTDGGTTWQNVSTGTSGGTQYIYGIDANTALVAGNPTDAYVYRTTDGGTTWTMVLSQVGGFFNGIAMFSATHGFLTGDPVGGRWANFKTTDGGATWDSTGMFLAQAGTEAGWNNGLQIRGTNVYFGTSNSRIYYSTNSGASFSPIAIPLTNSFGIWFISDSRGIVAGSAQGAVSTMDGGTNWTSLPVLASGTIYSVIGNSVTWFHTRGTRLFQSTDDGATWDTAYVAPGTLYHISKARNMADVCYVVGAGGFIMKGTGFGLPVELTSFTASAVNDQIVLNWSTSTEVNNRGFEIERSTHGSDFITVGFVNGAGTTTEIQNYSYSDKVPAGIYTYRLKQLDYNGNYEYSQTVEIDLTGALSYVLEQNYPNPFNPSTTISFVTKDQGHVSLKVYNVIGDEVASLVNGNMESGIHTVLFDASNLSSGVYFYTLTSGNFTETRKMMLMK